MPRFQCVIEEMRDRLDLHVVAFDAEMAARVFSFKNRMLILDKFFTGSFPVRVLVNVRDEGGVESTVAVTLDLTIDAQVEFVDRLTEPLFPSSNDG